MKDITEEMVMELNNELSVKGCPFRYKYQHNYLFPSMKLTFPNMNCVDSCIINVTKEFLDWLRLWFKTKYEIELDCNNDASVLWSNTYDDHVKHGMQIIKADYVDADNEITKSLEIKTHNGRQCNISQFILLLKKAKEEFGDLPVYIEDVSKNICGGFSSLYLKPGYDKRKEFGEDYYAPDSVHILW